MHVSAKLDYAVRALLHLAERAPAVVNVETLSAEQQLPRLYAEAVLNDLRKHGYVASRRGARGGYRLAVAPEQIGIGALVRLVDGPFVTVHDADPASVRYPGAAQHVPALWGTVDDALHGVLDAITLADVLAGRLPSPGRA